jgi:hypothetical protein
MGWFVGRRELLKLQHPDAHTALDNPGERSVEPISLMLEVFQHRFRKIEALLALVSAHVEDTSAFKK